MFETRVTRRTPKWGQAARLCVLVSCFVQAAGCSTVQRINESKLSVDTPVDWWHDLQGGRIAQDRPPPPGANDPYPDLHQVPERPVPTDAATRRALSDRLAAERDRTQRAAARDPIIPAGAPPAAPRLAAAAPVPRGAPGGATAAPGNAGPAAAPSGPEPSKAVLEAATAPPAPPAPRAASGSPAAASAAPAAPGAVPAAPVAVPAALGAVPLPASPLPALPEGAPPLPQLPGLPAATFAAATPRPLPQAVIAFSRGSSALPASAEPALRALAGLLAGGGMVVQAGGDADGPAPDRQAAALPLGLARARAIQMALVAAGVPSAAIRVEAAGLGRTGSARLLP